MILLDFDAFSNKENQRAFILRFQPRFISGIGCSRLGF